MNAIIKFPPNINEIYYCWLQVFCPMAFELNIFLLTITLILLKNLITEGVDFKIFVNLPNNVSLRITKKFYHFVWGLYGNSNRRVFDVECSMEHRSWKTGERFYENDLEKSKTPIIKSLYIPQLSWFQSVQRTVMQHVIRVIHVMQCYTRCCEIEQLYR